MQAEAPTTSEGKGPTKPQQKAEENGDASTIPPAVHAAVNAGLEYLNVGSREKAFLSNAMNALSAMDDAINKYINDTEIVMSKGDLRIVHMYYDATRQCLQVANKIKHRASLVRSELRKIRVSHDFHEEGQLDEALKRLEGVDTNKMLFGSELDDVIAATVEAYRKVSEACQTELRDVMMGAQQRSRKYLMVAGVAAVAGASMAILNLVGVALTLFPSGPCVGLSKMCAGVVFGGLVCAASTKRLGDIQEFSNMVAEEQARLKDAIASSSGLVHSLETIQTAARCSGVKVRCSGVKASDKKRVVAETGSGVAAGDCAVASAAVFFLGLAGAAYMFRSVVQNVVVGSFVSAGILAAGITYLLATQRTPTAQALRCRIAEEQTRLGNALMRRGEYIQSLNTVQTTVKRSFSAAEDQNSVVAKTGNGRSSADVAEFFSQHFKTVENDYDEMDNLCKEGDVLFKTARAAFGNFAGSRHLALVGRLD